MFKMKHISEVYVDPTSSFCKVGSFDGPATSRADIFFVREGIQSAQTSINSVVLREALLSRPDICQDVLGLSVMEVTQHSKRMSDFVIEMDELKADNKSKAERIKELEAENARLKSRKIDEVK